MHTYRKGPSGTWEVVFDNDQIGPTFGIEAEAAAFACFLNGGRYNPYEVEAVFASVPPPEDDDDSIHPDRPKAFDNDYPIEATQRHK